MTELKVKYGDILLNDYFDVAVVKRPLPDFRATGTQIYGRHGEDFENASIGTREIQIAVMAHADTRQELQQAARTLADILATGLPDDVVNLRISDEKDPDGNQLYRRVVPFGVPELVEYAHAARWIVRFKQFSPFLYGKKRVESLRANQSRAFDAGGNFYAWPDITATPTSNTYTIEQSGVGAITFKGSIAGKKLTIDMAKQTVKVSPSADGDGLQIGSRFFSIDGPVALRANAPTEVSWRERWL